MTAYKTTGVKAGFYIRGDAPNDFAELVELTEHPTDASGLSSDELLSDDGFKKLHAPYRVYGVLDGEEQQQPSPSRTKTTVTGRDVLFIDVDDESEYLPLLKVVIEKLEPWQMNFVAYPTISNGIKSGARMRIGIELDKFTSREEYMKIWKVLTKYFGVQSDVSAIASRFNQLEGVYVLTDKNAVYEPYIVNDGHPLESAAFVALYDGKPELYEREKKPVQRGRPTGSLWDVLNKQQQQEIRLPWYDAIQMIEHPVQEGDKYGGWNMMFTKLYGKLLKAMDGERAQEIIRLANDKGDDPMSERELTSIFRSINKRERAQNGI